MNRKRSIVNTLDKERLAPIIDSRWSGEGDWPITRLRMLIENSRIVEPRRVPRNVVTMNSRIRIHDPLWESDETFTLTYPDSPAPHSNGDAVSVTSPIGAAIFGSREGDEVRWIGPRGPRRIVVSAIEFQPEREGRYDL